MKGPITDSDLDLRIRQEVVTAQATLKNSSLSSTNNINTNEDYSSNKHI